MNWFIFWVGYCLPFLIFSEYLSQEISFQNGALLFYIFGIFQIVRIALDYQSKPWWQ